MVIEPIQPSVFQQRVSLDSTFRSLRNQLDLDTNFIDDMSAAFAKDQSPAQDDPFDLALNVGSSGIGILDNTLAGSSSGIPVNVSEDSVTFTTENSPEKLRAAPYHDLSIRRGAENTLTIINETTNEALRLEDGQAVEVTGEGQAEIKAGEDRTLRLESGEAAEVIEEDGSLKLDETTFRNTITLSGGTKELRVLEDSGNRITLFTGANESLEFNAGETGSLEQLQNGGFRIRNRTTNESLTVDSLETLKAQGNAEVAVGDQPAFEIEDGDSVTFSSTENGIELTNQSVTETVEVEDTGEPSRNFPGLGTSETLGSQTRVISNLMSTTESILNLSGDSATGGENPFGSIDQVIEPLDERSRNELTELGLSLDENEQSVFFEESQVAEPFEELPFILGGTEEPDGFLGGNDDGGFLETDDSEDAFVFDDESNSTLLEDE